MNAVITCVIAGPCDDGHEQVSLASEFRPEVHFDREQQARSSLIEPILPTLAVVSAHLRQMNGQQFPAT